MFDNYNFILESSTFLLLDRSLNSPLVLYYLNSPQSSQLFVTSIFTRFYLLMLNIRIPHFSPVVLSFLHSLLWSFPAGRPWSLTCPPTADCGQRVSLSDRYSAGIPGTPLGYTGSLDVTGDPANTNTKERMGRWVWLDEFKTRPQVILNWQIPMTCMT